MMRALTAILALVLAILALSSLYVVNETEQVIITQFGEPVGGTVDQPGLHVKLPFIQQANRFDKRFLEWDGNADEFTTRDKRFIFVDTMARWQITDPLLFFQRLRDERGAQSRLDDILDGETRNAVANHELVEIVRTSNREPERDPSLAERGHRRVPADRARPREDAPGDPDRRPLANCRPGNRDPRRALEAHQLHRGGAAQGLRPDDRRAPAHRHPLPLRRRGRGRAHPGRARPRAQAHPVRGVQDGPGGARQGRRSRRRASTPRPTTRTPSPGTSTAS